MTRTPYVKNYEIVEDFPSEDTPYGATQLQNYEDSISGIDTDLATVEEELGNITKYLTSNVTWDGSVSNANGTLVKYGKVVYFAYLFTSPSSVTGDKVIATIPVGYRPSTMDFLPLVDTSNYTTSTAHMAIYNGSDLVLVAASWTSNKTYRGNAIWIIPD